jgi:predicted transcriptional regulator
MSSTSIPFAGGRHAQAVILAIVTLDAIGISLVMPIVPSLLREVGHGGELGWHFGAFLSLYALMQFLCAPVLGALSDRFGRRPVLLVSVLGAAIDALVDAPPFTEDPASRKLARIGLANYFAGALLLPYGAFLEAAESLRYDIDLLGQRFGVGFETVCHRLSTLQRLGAPGVPFFFVRVDKAGNISKRQSATHFHFSRTGGTCPLWNVYEAFAQPERILPQLARMPDGRRYLWIARSVSRGQRGWGSPRKTFSIGLGCDIRHAPRLVYAKGLDLQDPEAATPIGMGCKVCERERCPQRAFPFIGEALDVDENQSRFAPYGFER